MVARTASVSVCLPPVKSLPDVVPAKGGSVGLAPGPVAPRVNCCASVALALLGGAHSCRPECSSGCPRGG